MNKPTTIAVEVGVASPPSNNCLINWYPVLAPSVGVPDMLAEYVKKFCDKKI